MALKFSVTQVMFGNSLDLTQTCALLQRLGYDGLELTCRTTTDITPSNVLSRAEEIKSVVAAHGLVLSNFASNLNLDEKGSMETVRLLAEGAKACGAPAIRLGCRRYPADGSEDYWDIYEGAVKQYAAALEITRAFGLKVFVEMHGGTIHPSASLAYRIVSNFDAKDIGVIYDPQNMVRDGFETIPMALQLLGPYLAHVHIGAHEPYARGELDENGQRQWLWRRTAMSEGLYDISMMLRCLQQRKGGYNGFISLEDLGGADARGAITPE